MRKLTTLLSLALPALGWAQQENTMYSEGKIYVVIAVIGIIFVGLAAYLFQLDRKITKIENENNQIAIIIAIAVLIGYTLVKLGNSATYSSFADATNKPGEITTVIGYLNLHAPMDFDPKTVTLRFNAKDKKGNESLVVYNQPKPQDFERSEEITMTGYATDSAFVATDILMKCPSKYNEQNEVDSDKIYK